MTLLIDEIIRVVRRAESLRQLELSAREEPAREVGVARVEGDGCEREVGPRLHQLCYSRHLADLLAGDAVLQVERTKREGQPKSAKGEVWRDLGTYCWRTHLELERSKHEIVVHELAQLRK